MKNKSFTENKKLLVLAELLIILMLVAFVVWSYNSTDRMSEAQVSDVAAQVLAEGIPEGMAQAGALDIKRVFGVNPEDFQGIVYYAPVSNMDACELVIARCDDSVALQSLSESISDRRKSQMTVFEGYAPEQYSQLKGAVVTVKGNFLFYMVSDDAYKYYGKFSSAIR